MAFKEQVIATGWGKIIGTAIISAIIPVAAMLISVGELKSTIAATKETLDRHIEVYTPEKSAQMNRLESRIAVDEEAIRNIRESLKEIKDQNQEMLRILRRK